MRHKRNRLPKQRAEPQEQVNLSASFQQSLSEKRNQLSSKRHNRSYQKRDYEMILIKLRQALITTVIAQKTKKELKPLGKKRIILTSQFKNRK